MVFPHGQEMLNNALLAGQAISYLFIRKDKGWYVHATTERVEPQSSQRGSMEYCNAVVWQEEASDRGDAWRCSRICGAVCQRQLDPIVIENLDLDKKKSGRSKKTNRKVSMMAYSAFRQVLSSRPSGRVEVIGIQPDIHQRHRIGEVRARV